MATFLYSDYNYDGNAGGALAINPIPMDPGYTVIVGVTWETTDADPVVSDTQGNTYLSRPKVKYTGANLWSQVFYCMSNLASASNTISVSYGSATPTNRSIMVRIYGDMAAAGGYVDEAVGQASGASTVSTSSNLDATGAGVIFCIANVTGTDTFTLGTDYTDLLQTATWAAYQHRIITTGGSYPASINLTGSDNILLNAVLFQDTAPEPGENFTLTAESGTYSLTGQEAGTQYGRKVTAAQGSYTLTGQDANLVLDSPAIVLTAETGTYEILGSDGLADYAVTAQFDTFTVAGQAANLRRSYTLTAERGVYLKVGYDPNLLYSGSGPKVITAEYGTYSLTGQDISLRRAAKLVTERGLYSINGFAVVGGAADDQGTGSSGVLKVQNVVIVSTSGRTKWVNYIPVKQVSITGDNVGKYSNNAAVEVRLLGSGSGLIEWVDYIPVVEVGDGESGRWRYDNNGWIPIVIVE